MKVLKTEKEYVFDDFRELQCGTCNKKLWDMGQEIISKTKLQCPQCKTIYSFQPTRWRVLADIPQK